MTQLSFRNTTGTLSEFSQIKSSLETGMLEDITVHFPPGCNSLVEIKVFHGSKQVLPEKEGLALDSATQRFSIGEPVRAGDPINVIWTNHDDTYEHTVSVIAGIVPKVKILPEVK